MIKIDSYNPTENSCAYNVQIIFEYAKLFSYELLLLIFLMICFISVSFVNWFDLADRRDRKHDKFG